MKKLAFFPLAALAFAAACSDTSGVTAPDTASLNTTTVPTANGPTNVYGNFSLLVTLSGSAGSNQHPQGKGTCKDVTGNINNADPTQNTVWHAPGNPNQATGAKFCQGALGGSETLQCTTDAIPAVYAFGGQGVPMSSANAGGNEELNFVGTSTGTFVHFNSARNRYSRQGTLTAEYSCLLGGEPTDVEGTATISFNNNSNFIQVSSTSRKLSTVQFALGSPFGNVNGSLDWIYRDRNDIPLTEG